MPKTTALQSLELIRQNSSHRQSSDTHKFIRSAGDRIPTPGIEPGTPTPLEKMIPPPPLPLFPVVPSRPPPPLTANTTRITSRALVRKFWRYLRDNKGSEVPSACAYGISNFEMETEMSIRVGRYTTRKHTTAPLRSAVLTRLRLAKNGIL